MTCPKNWPVDRPARGWPGWNIQGEDVKGEKCNCLGYTSTATSTATEGYLFDSFGSARF